jgi:hypothetical protein
VNTVQDRGETAQIKAITEDLEAKQQADLELQRAVAEVAKRIEDCTIVGGDCFQEAQQRTAAAVSGIQEGTLRLIVAGFTCYDRGLVGQQLAECMIGITAD